MSPAPRLLGKAGRALTTVDVGTALVAVVALAGLAACSRDDEQPRPAIDLAPGFAKMAPLDSGPRALAKAGRKDEPWPGDVDASRLRDLQVTITQTIIHEAGAVTPPPNPDDPILARAREGAGRCFSSLAATPGSPPERSAHIVFTVIPTGTVSSADVSSSDTDDASVLDCLRQQALGTTFSDNAGGPLRTYAIDVRVIAKGTSGGR